MNIRKRLQVSNLLMVVIPVVVSALVAVVVALVAWRIAYSGSGFGVDDSEDFFRASAVVAQTVESEVEDGGVEALEGSEAFHRLLDTANLSLVVLDGDGSEVWRYGTLGDEDAQLVSDASSVDGDVQLARGSHCLSARTVQTSDGTHRLLILGSVSQFSAAVTKATVATATLVVVVALVVAVLLTGRFLSRFVLRHITEPLDLLAEGTRRISDGDLGYRLPEGRDDEFAPVFEDFNAMATRLSDSVDQQRRLERRRAELVSGLSHDLRSPLTSIQAYSEGILDGIAKTPEKQREYVARIQRKSQEMGALLSQMSAVSRVDRSVEDTNLEVVALDEAIREWLEESVGSYELRGAAVSSDLRPVRARIDAGLLGRILSNLLDNCLRYATGEDGTCKVEVRCGREGDMAWVSVDDDGPGVEEGTESRLFDLFYRGDAARSRTSEGHGIGLAVVSLGMERMGGSVSAGRSELGGLRVLMKLPAATEASGNEREE